MADDDVDEQKREIRNAMAQIDCVYVSSFQMFSNHCCPEDGF